MVSFRLLLPFLSHLLAQGQVAKNSAAQRSLTFKLKNKALWPNAILRWRFVNIPAIWTEAEKKKFRDAVAEVHKQLDGCIQFIEDTTRSCLDYNSLGVMKQKIKSAGKLCYASDIGRVNDEQFINIPPQCSAGNMKHEVLHALGLSHSMQHPNRNDHVRYIGSGTEQRTYRLDELEDFDVEYDPHSIMHYPGYEYIGNDTDFDDSIRIGQRDELSARDISYIKHIYSCPASSTSSTTSTSSASSASPPAQLPVEQANCSQVKLEEELSFCVSDATIDVEDNSTECINGEACNVKCAPGYSAAVGGEKITCNPMDGTVVLPKITCEECTKSKLQAKINEVPGVVFHGTCSSPFTSCSVKCSSKYETGTGSVTCSAGVASSDLTSCTPTNCYQVKLEEELFFEVDDATIDVADNSTECINGEACNVKCEPGYSGAVGDEKITCNPTDGTVVLPTITCTSIAETNCSKFKLIEELELSFGVRHAIIDVGNFSTQCIYGEACNVKCAPGYSGAVGGEKITCDPMDGTVVLPTMTCEGVIE